MENGFGDGQSFVRVSLFNFHLFNKILNHYEDLSLVPRDAGRGKSARLNTL